MEVHLADDTVKGNLFLKGWKLSLVTFSLSVGTFLVALDVNIIGVAIPKITSVFDSLGDAAWYASTYLLTVTALQPTMGYLYKSFNVRLVYFTNVIIFEAGSVLCAAAPSSTLFILGRAIAGVGAAGLLQGALAIITHIVELERRPLFMGIVISVFGLSICVGPVMGGAFVDSIGWRWCFWINLPIGAVAMILLVLFLKVQSVPNQYTSLSLRRKIANMDLIGTVTFLGAICCLTLALQWGGQTKPWHSSQIIGLFVGFGLLTIAFCCIQARRGENALIPPRVLRQRSILVGSLYLFFVGMLVYVYSFYLPFYFQAVQDVLPITSGVRIIPFVLAEIILIGVTGAIASHTGHYVPFMVVGMVICCVGAGLVTRLDIDNPTAAWAAYLVIAGAGLGTAMQLPYTALQVVLSEADVPIGNALFVFFNQLGGMIAIPIAQSLFLSKLRAEVTTLLPNFDPEIVIAAGAAELNEIAAGSKDVLLLLRTAYSSALRSPYILALSASCIAAICVPALEWRNIKTEAAERREHDLKETLSGGQDGGEKTAEIREDVKEVV
ncbi:efflux pump antibiotic resistance protein [Sclerotinia borealis F-4128]|uniref:Efflux pump antibiotic resistance protein n=1 Tax=Sclerotinia borealis (strain F-4128) TaxID=1432307 RepID=W9CQR0_SCLBF|nr:efflux pump antibiotic resistance protein [Sclerotinia borealis F-4128]